MIFLTGTRLGWRWLNRTRVVQVATLAALAVLAAVAGPFGTFESGTFLERLVYWSVAIGVSIAVAIGIRYTLRDLMKTPRFWLGELFISLGTTFVFTPFLYVWTIFWFESSHALLPSPFWLGVNVLLICSLISCLRYGLPTLSDFPVSSQEDLLPRLADRLEAGVRAPIVRLEAEGHYVLVVTQSGSARLRMRLTDAIREMEPVEGYCAHRSHWVARSAIAQAGSAQGRPVLEMTNGDVVPVSRKYQPDLEAAGLL